VDRRDPTPREGREEVLRVENVGSQLSRSQRQTKKTENSPRRTLANDPVKAVRQVDRTIIRCDHKKLCIGMKFAKAIHESFPVPAVSGIAREQERPVQSDSNWAHCNKMGTFSCKRGFKTNIIDSNGTL
jgi:hypothetical protein